MKPIFIVGGGPSLRGFNFDRLKGCDVFATNAAYVDVPWSRYLVFADERFWQWNHLTPEWAAFTGQKVTTWKRSPPGIIRYHGVQHGVKLAQHPMQLAGSNSGEKALNLAYHFRPPCIYLLGFDMKPNGNYHKRHKLGERQAHYASKFVPSMNAMGRELNKLGVKVINACPDSGVDVFPRISLDDLPI